MPHKLDVSVPLARYAEMVERAPEAVSAVDPGARTIVYGHVADGNVHVNVLGPAADDESADDAVLELVLELGGSISAEHGIGVAKVDWLVRDRGEAAVAAMRAIKRAWDPDNLLGPSASSSHSSRRGLRQRGEEDAHAACWRSRVRTRRHPPIPRQSSFSAPSAKARSNSSLVSGARK